MHAGRKVPYSETFVHSRKQLSGIPLFILQVILKVVKNDLHMHISFILLQVVKAHGNEPSDFKLSLSALGITLFLTALCTLFFGAWRTWQITKGIYKKSTGNHSPTDFRPFLDKLTRSDIELIIASRQKNKVQSKTLKSVLVALLTLSANIAIAQPAKERSAALLGETGIIITITLLTIPALAALVLLIVKVRGALNEYRNSDNVHNSEAFLRYLDLVSDSELEALLDSKPLEGDYRLSGDELSGRIAPDNSRGILEISRNNAIAFFTTKKKALKRPEIDPQLSKLIIWYLGSAAFWLVFGTSVGEYLGIKFVAPDADHQSWLSFGRLRPVHTNAVFWGWASLAMLGLGHYVIPRVSNTSLFSYKLGWYALGMINFSVIAGTLCLMSGINNAGGEYREYIWPVMAVFAGGLIVTLYNFLNTVSNRTTKEIYISSWYIISSIIFVIVITLVAYIPNWQDGLGETIVQGYYMHQGVGMWFMLFTLGLVYYFLPQQLNRPIYSYSLGILAFWTQILFYTTIGTHHFVFSAIPWWLQTVAIVGSVGMVIPVVAGTTNFLMTFKGAWHKLRYSYTLPFFLVGIIFYFTGSLQGTAEAFRYTNLIWHFTDFTVAHSHLTMYGIISFLLWGGVYAILPRITGREAPQVTIGAHFWLSLIGLLFYTVPLMYGSTLRGLMWMEGKPFIDSVVFMAPYWLWRAIGGSLMWLSHLFFAYNFYKMISAAELKDVAEINQTRLREKHSLVSIKQK